MEKAMLGIIDLSAVVCIKKRPKKSIFYDFASYYL
jgi:hypothetical protein